LKIIKLKKVNKRMKKIVRLTESDITRIVKRVMNEAKRSSSVDRTNPYKCAKRYVEFLFEPSKVSEGVVTSGGDLFLWNKNKIPKLKDDEAYSRFIKHLEFCVESDLNSEEECGGITLGDIMPFIRELYIDEIISNY
jgi:hypothetical protein